MNNSLYLIGALVYAPFKEIQTAFATAIIDNPLEKEPWKDKNVLC